MAYTLDDYSVMLHDRARVDAYLAAMAATVRPGMSVVDLGTGTGFFAFEACRLGAARVYAIDPNPAIHLARELALANGLADRITFREGDSTTVELPERVDVVISDLRGAVPVPISGLGGLIAARDRYLKPGGALIPWRDRLYVAVVEHAEAHARLLHPWEDRAGKNALEPLVRAGVNTWLTSSRLPVTAQLTAPAAWTEVRYDTVDTLTFAGAVRVEVHRAGVGNGLSLWFDAELVEGIGFTSGPTAPDSVYGTPFLPWPEAVSLDEGDVIEIALRAEAIAGERIWRWSTRILARDGRVKASFVQSTFLGAHGSLDDLRRRSPDHRPATSADLEVDRFILDQFDGERSLAAIGAAAAARFPDRIADERGGLARAYALAQRYRV